MQPSTILFTGGTSGIGAHAVRSLRRDGHHVIVGARDPSRAAKHLDLPGEFIAPLDLTDLDSVRSFGDAAPNLDALVCNAGVQIVRETRTTSLGFEETFAVNHLAHYLLILRVLPKLRRGGRIVLTCSGTHNPQEPLARRFGFEGGLYTSAQRLLAGDVGVEADERTLGMHRYATSKLANVMTVFELARRVDASVARIFGYDPGLVPGTGLGRDHPALLRGLVRMLSPLLSFLPDVSTPRRSGNGLAWLATSQIDAPSGSHFDFARRPARLWDQADDHERCRDLFEGSARATGESLPLDTSPVREPAS